MSEAAFLSQMKRQLASAGAPTAEAAYIVNLANKAMKAAKRAVGDVLEAEPAGPGFATAASLAMQMIAREFELKHETIRTACLNAGMKPVVFTTDTRQ